jgi:hypothetical protein
MLTVESWGVTATYTSPQVNIVKPLLKLYPGPQFSKQNLKKL